MIISNEKYSGITYNMDTGEFYRKKVKGKHGIKEGVWGTVCCYGYLNGGVDYKMYKLHRLAFEFMGKSIPKGMQVDHINCIRTDNRWVNLRLVSQRQNAQNKNQIIKTGKLIGSHWCKRDKKYISQLGINGKTLCLGYYDTELEAHTAYMDYMDENGIEYLPEIDRRMNEQKSIKVFK